MSTYTDGLRQVAENLKTEGWDRRAAIIFHAADRMDRMENLIVDLMENDNDGKKSSEQEPRS